MLKIVLKTYLIIIFLVLLSACGGSDSESPPTPPTPLQPKDVARFLNHASFGADMETVEKIIDSDYSSWLDQQILLPASSHVEYLTSLEPTLNLLPDETLQRKHRMEAWFHHTITAPDQLRQRVAFALSEIFVISEKSNFGDDTYGIANYYDLLVNNAFGNYRDLLEQVTLSPIMGMYLSMLGNEKPNNDKNIRPDENYAREVLQLFSIGLVELNLDGSIKIQDGQSISTYDQNLIKAFAHVFTGWNFNGTTNETWWQFNRNYNSMEPMTAVPDFHDMNEKILFNDTIITANQTPEQDLTQALDNIFNHPNVGPFISKQLIKKLVTSNPSADYVERISRVFNDNNQGVRGDLAAVVKAVLLDDEALNGAEKNPKSFGKIREPILRAVHLWRTFSASSPNGRLQFNWPDYFFGQAPLAAHHVFNFFSPNYAPPGIVSENNLIAPELEIITENYLTRTNNFFAYSTLWGHTEADENNADDRILIDLASLKPMADDIEALLDYFDILLLGGTMDDDMRAILTSAYQQNSDAPEDERLSNLLFLVMVSPQYIVQR